jgi:uncharacterized protein (TIGR03067 family)
MAHLMPILVFLALGLTAGSPVAPIPEGEKLVAEELKKLEGTWKVVSLSPAELKVKDDFRVVFKEGKVKFGDRGPSKFKLDPSKEPKWFDCDVGQVFKDDEKEMYAPGIYNLDGDKLTLAIVNEGTGEMFKPRPKNFKDKFPGQMMHLERVKK